MHNIVTEDLTSENIILALIKLRSEAREAHNYSLADEIRSQLQSQRVELEDTIEETKWSVI